MGYEKIAATPPFYFGYTTKQLAHYYYDIAEAVDMPVFYYNIPINTFNKYRSMIQKRLNYSSQVRLQESNILI